MGFFILISGYYASTKTILWPIQCVLVYNIAHINNLVPRKWFAISIKNQESSFQFFSRAETMIGILLRFVDSMYWHSSFHEIIMLISDHISRFSSSQKSCVTRVLTLVREFFHQKISFISCTLSFWSVDLASGNIHNITRGNSWFGFKRLAWKSVWKYFL
jgi:hypothetical protein